MNEITLEASIASFTMGDLLGHIRSMIQSIAVTQKDVLTLDEAAIYTGLSKTYLYKITASRKIPCWKPFGKMLYFKRSELDAWMLQHPIKTDEQLEAEALQRMYSANESRTNAIKQAR